MAWSPVESATAVTLRRQDGKEDVLLRSEIEEMASSGQSLMPEGIEKDLKPQDLADLIAFLASAGHRANPSERSCPSRPMSDPWRSRCTSCRSRPGCRSSSAPRSRPR